MPVCSIYRRNTSMSPDHHKAPPDEVAAALKHIDQWEFDIWELNHISENRSLRYVGFDVIQREELIQKLKVIICVVRAHQFCFCFWNL